MTTFTAETYVNRYLARGATAVSAVVTVAASGAGPARQDRGGATEVLILDVSGSMRADRKLQEAKAAMVAAIDSLRDGVLFAVVAGNHSAAMVWPRSGGLAVASRQSRSHAKEAMLGVRADGGTAMGTWLSMARTLFAQAPEGVRHAILLTDGKNETEAPGALAREIESCMGLFQCDCRGVGADWAVDELRSISSALLGSTDIVPRPEELAAHFTRLMGEAMAKSVASVALRLWTPRHASVAFVRQVVPELVELTDRSVAAGELARDYPTGAWGDEERDYHVELEVHPGEVGDEILAGRVSLVVDGAVVADSRIVVEWTDDEELATVIEPKVAALTGRAKLAGAIRDGLDARKQGDVERATTKLGEAVRLAAEAGDDEKLGLLSRVVDVVDAPTGTVRLKSEVAVVDEMTLDTRSTKTSRVR